MKRGTQQTPSPSNPAWLREYGEDVGRQLKKEGLWDSHVMATLEVTYDQPGTTATPRDSTYRLVRAEPFFLGGPRLF
jgi:hypothetical protein